MSINGDGKGPDGARPVERIYQTTNSWLFHASKVNHDTPSEKDGYPSKQELIGRAKGVNFIIQVGLQLRVSQMTIYTASMFLHRFYMRFSMAKKHYYEIGASCLFLATKVEDSTRRLRDVAVACTKVASKNLNMVVDEQSKDFWKWKNAIIFNEEFILEALCFDFSLDSPYELMSYLLDKLDLGLIEDVNHAARTFINESCRTTLGLIRPAKTVAAAALYWAIKATDNTLPRDPPWWEIIGVNKSEVYEACNYMADKHNTLVRYGVCSESGRRFERVTPIDRKRKPENEEDGPTPKAQRID